MNTNQNKIDEHKKAFHNREAVENSVICGCFFCMNVYPSEQINQWVDNGQTALCPHCDIDAVLPGQTDTDFLQEMCETYFTGLYENNGSESK